MNQDEFQEQIDATKALIRLRLKKAGKFLSNRNINQMAKKMVMSEIGRTGKPIATKVTDPELIKKLNGKLMDKIIAGDTDDIMINIPEESNETPSPS